MAERFPHITISIAHGKDDSDATGDLNSLSVGFGVFQAWIFLVIFGMGYVFAPLDSSPEHPGSSRALPAHRVRHVPPSRLARVCFCSPSPISFC